MRKAVVSTAERARRLKEGLIVPFEECGEGYYARQFGAVWDWRVRSWLFPDETAMRRWLAFELPDRDEEINEDDED